MDPYKLLDVQKNFTLSQLKENYKRIALQVHPDKGGTEQLFQLVTKAYKLLLEEHNRRVAEKQFHDLKHDFQKSVKLQQPRQNTQFSQSVAATQSSQSSSQGRNFDINRFNQIFNENKLETVTDKGYSDWMTEDTVPKQKQLKSFNEKAFHKTFEKQTAVDRNNKYIIPYKEPEPLLMTKKIGFTEIGQEDIDDFSGDNTSRKNLNFMDYKVAHTTNRIVDPSIAKNIRQYKNVDELERDRSQVRFEMNEDEMEEYILQKKLEKIREQKRMETLRQQEQALAEHYERVNRVALGLRR